jgi:4-aminobutyrate aminotransferase/(S)-3-amino-2-methylpropionate transaminase
VTPYKVGGAFAPEVYRLPFPYAYREGVNANFADMLKNVVAPDAVAAVILEPVLGEGGFVPAPREFMTALRAYCDKHGIVLIADEIQTGFGRTGKMFASETIGFEPDLMTFAKSVAGGMPLAGVVGKSAIVDKAQPGALGGTYAGNPLACAAALATIEALESEKLADRAGALGVKMRARFETWSAKSSHIGEIRGLGAMLALELVTDKASKEPATELTKRIQDRCLSKGLIILTAGTYSNIIRILVPLVITDGELDEGLAILESALFDA